LIDYKETENQLKDFILNKYKSIREFAIHIDMPYSTIDNIFKRGLSKANVTNIISICKALGISTDMLAEGKIIALDKTQADTDTLSKIEQRILGNFRSLNSEGQSKVYDYVEDLVTTGRYKKLLLHTEFGKEA